MGTKFEAAGPALPGGLEGTEATERGGGCSFLVCDTGCDDHSPGYSEPFRAQVKLKCKSQSLAHQTSEEKRRESPEFLTGSWSFE